MKYIRYFLSNMTGWKKWNEQMREKGYHYAIITPRPFRIRLRSSLVFTVDLMREDLAKKIAPWLEDTR